MAGNNLLLASILKDENTTRGGANALAEQFPGIYGGLLGISGTAPDEVGGSVLDGSHQAQQSGADIGFPIGLIAQMSPLTRLLNEAKFVGSSGKLPSLYGQIGAIDPKSQKKLVDRLTSGIAQERYRLGDLKPAQAEALDNFGGSPGRGLLDVFMGPSGEAHIHERRIVKQGLTPEKVGHVSRQAMRPDSVAMPAKTSDDYPTLLSQQFSEGNDLYRAEMPLRQVPDGFEVVSVITRGKRGKK